MSRADKFDQADFRPRDDETPAEAPSKLPTITPKVTVADHVFVWPVSRPRIGQTVMKDRDGKGRPHHGVDLFVAAGSRVYSVTAGRVLRVMDGRLSKVEHRKRAGLWIDIIGNDGRVYRYLHLASVAVRGGDLVSPGTLIATTSDAHESGAGDEPHLHFEIRASDWSGGTHGKYGAPIDPLPILQGAKHVD